jgi:hypothetical protein
VLPGATGPALATDELVGEVKDIIMAGGLRQLAAGGQIISI